MSKYKANKILNMFSTKKINDILNSAYAFQAMQLIAKPSECHLDKLPAIKEYLKLMDSKNV